MKVTTERNDKESKLEINVTLDKDEVKKHVNAYYKKIANVRIPGFRPGRAPRPVLDQNYGGHVAVMAQALSEMIEKVAPRAMDEKGVTLISRPSVDDAPKLEDNKEYTFTIVGEPKPELDLKSFDAVSVTLPPKEAEEKDIDAQLETMRSYYTDFQTIETKRAAKKGDFAMVDLECKQGDKEVQGLNSNGRLVELGASTVPQAIEKELIGMKAGETKEFTFNAKGDDAFSYIGEEDVNAKVTLNELREQKLPELDDAFAEKMGSKNMEELRDMIKNMLNGQMEQMFNNVKERECTKELAKRLVGDVPESFITYTQGEVRLDFYNTLQRQGATFDQYLQQQNITKDQFEEDLKLEADEVAKRSLALDALARHLKLEVTDEDIDKEFAAVESATRKDWEEACRMTELREALLRNKAMEWLLDKAKVTIDKDFGKKKEDKKSEKKPAKKSAKKTDKDTK